VENHFWVLVLCNFTSPTGRAIDLMKQRGDTIRRFSSTILFNHKVPRERNAAIARSALSSGMDEFFLGPKREQPGSRRRLPSRPVTVIYQSKYWTDKENHDYDIANINEASGHKGARGKCKFKGRSRGPAPLRRV
jgi:hypothetical protein